MLDSVLTLTKRRSLWMLIFFLIALAGHYAVLGVTGTYEPLFLLAALAIPVAFVIMGAYTLIRRLTHGPRTHAGHV